MVDSQFRHPKLALLLVVAGVIAAFVAVAGPRDGGLVGVGDASAADAEATTTEPPDDGVVFTAPGELVSVIEGPTTTEPVVSGAGTTSGSTVVAPSTTRRPASAAPTTTQPVVETTAAGSDVVSTTTSMPDEGTDPDGSTGDPSTSDGPGTQNTSTDASTGGDEVALGAPTAFAAVDEIVGSASGAPAQDPVVLGQLGTRDANSTPWMLLVGANFLVAGGALAALRLRQ